MKIVGPFAQILTLNHLPLKGKLGDQQLEIIADGGVLIDEEGLILEVAPFERLTQKLPQVKIERIESEAVLIPGFIDCHTHIAFSGSRAADYAMRVGGKTYLEIAHAGGGIWDTVSHTRQASPQELVHNTLKRADRHLRAGVTTIEVKSGYGLGIESELRILRAIKNASEQSQADLISTCLAAHMKPNDFKGEAIDYLRQLSEELFPILQSEKLSQRIDIFIEESAFKPHESEYYLQKAEEAGFQITVHADQFSTGGSAIAVKFNALSADHLEASTEHEINLLAKSDTVSVALPGASVGLGMQFTPARKLLDAGACVAIASDWNPGSAPMGNLLSQACILGAYEKLSLAETLAGLTVRAAKALALDDRGNLQTGKLADMQAYPCADYREIFYQQGELKPIAVWKKGKRI